MLPVARVSCRAGENDAMVKQLRMAVVLALGLGAGAPVALAAPPTGDEVLDSCTAALEGIFNGFDDGSDAIAAQAAAKLAQLDDRGASEEQLDAEADKALEKVLKLYTRSVAQNTKVARACTLKIVKLDEPALIAQVTQIAAQRAGVIAQMDLDRADALGAIADALAAELGD